MASGFFIAPGIQPITGHVTVEAGEQRVELDQDTLRPELTELPDVTVSVGETFQYSASASDPAAGDIKFKDDTTLFDISEDGFIEFTPSEEQRGTHYVAIIAKNRMGKGDVKIMRITVP